MQCLGADAMFTQLPMLTTYIYCSLVTDVDALMPGASESFGNWHFNHVFDGPCLRA